MLFILTGDFQTGKTRWLQALITQMQETGVLVNGVVAPGQWLDHGEEAQQRFEKLGINNTLLPQGETIVFGLRRDLASQGEACQQAIKAQLGWAISDEAINRVNEHFAQLAQGSAEKPGLLIVDELGPLELLKNGGLTCAMDMLAQGPTALNAHALIVVRESLIDTAMERFGTAWGRVEIIRATPEAAAQVKALFD